jgi:hypothetical protein
MRKIYLHKRFDSVFSLAQKITIVPNNCNYFVKNTNL